VLVTETVRVTGLDTELSKALGPWRRPLAAHDPGKVLLDLAVTLVLGGDALADIALLRSEPGLFGQVASDATVSRAITALAADADESLAAIDRARAAARSRAWALAGTHSPAHDTSARNPLVIDLDATLVTAHSDKEQAAPTFKRGFGFHPPVRVRRPRARRDRRTPGDPAEPAFPGGHRRRYACGVASLVAAMGRPALSATAPRGVGDRGRANVAARSRPALRGRRSARGLVTGWQLVQATQSRRS
jgi:hypothetical protein